MSNDIELRHLYYFKVLAEVLHFRKASDKLFITQPGLSRQIKQMEEIYKAKLFDRSKKRVELTPAGLYLKKEVDEIFVKLDFIKSKIKGISEGKITEISIGFIGSAAQNIMPELLHSLNKKYPLISVSMNELANNTQVQMLLKKTLDFGFVRMSVPPVGLIIKKVSEETFSLVIPKNHPIQQKHFNSLAQYKEDPFILFSREYSSAYYELVMSIFSDYNFVPNVHHRTVNALSIFKLVEKGLGVAIVPTSLQVGYNVEVNFIELKDIPQRSQLSLLWNPENENPGIASVLSEIKNITIPFQNS